jgi:hypothetical protein
MSSDYPGNDEPCARGSADAADTAGPSGSLGDTLTFGPTGRRSARSRRPFFVAGVAAAALLGGAGVAYAAGNSGPSVQKTASSRSSSPSPSPSPSLGHPGSRHFGGFGGFGGRPAGGFGRGGGILGAVHGQLVVPKSGGGYQTVDIQSGTVTAVSAAAITVKSADGFTQTYSVTSSTNVDAQRDGIGSIKVGNQVALLATVSGSTASAASIADLTLLGQGRQAFGYSGGGSSSPGGQAG